MKKGILILCFCASFFGFAQTPTVSVLSFNLDSFSLYNKWHTQTDTFFVVPIRLDTYVSGIDSFAFNLQYDGSQLSPILDLTWINHPSFILLMNYLGGAEFSMTDGGTIHADTFDMGTGNQKMLSVAFRAQNAFSQGIFNNCYGTLMYVAFKRIHTCEGSNFSLDFTNGLVATSYINPNQTNTFLLEGTQNYSADNNTLIANSGQVSKLAMEALIYQNGNTLETYVNFGTPPYTFLWNTGEISQNITPTNWSSLYYVVITDANNCTDTSNYLIALATNELSILEQEWKISNKFNLLGASSSKLKTMEIFLLYYENGKTEKRIILH